MKRGHPLQLVGAVEAPSEDALGQWPNLPPARHLDHGLIADVLLEARERRDELGRGAETRLYIIREHTGLLKIGIAKDPVARMKNLQVANAHPLTLVGTVAATVALEKFIHRSFAKERVRGEWFAMSPRLRQFLGLLETGNHFYRVLERDGDEPDAAVTVECICAPLDDAIWWAAQQEAS